MHPPLAPHQHQSCIKYIQALEECHRSGFFNKYFGGCNDLKLKLNECLRAERIARRDENRAKARAKRAKIREIWKEMEEPPMDEAPTA
ncbi:cytochrome c oxidase biogenesis protein Cmc1 like-domain-containing protein [Jimgerdemannia flammicorona]|uniref:COX assembly mitochondrial protein n=2 Tax=Jimgerdemannia flammicorona TaxID=994334 RepID=A0A433DFU3_9FUNG|nr:cytochrome c oxidase biogenesis protein Cmc1 like-domain-containing protein [Jimgerdemannia flammicorona]RUS34559.1 cytochrome c oxidase biogenesis protein Cmc1 like-domain-containing protein [Jimgerdemannia flammicorona]